MADETPGTGSDTEDFTCVERVPGTQTYCAQLRIWHATGDQFLVAKCTEPLQKPFAEAQARKWARDHKCKFQEA